MALGKALAAPLLALTLLMYLIIVAIAGWSLNRIMNNRDYFSGGSVGGNLASFPFSLLALIAGVVGIASALTGLHHLKSWRGESGAAAGSSALIAWLLTLLAFGLACKEIHISRNRGRRMKALEAFVIMAAFFQLLYLLILHAGLHSRKYGPGYHDHGRGYAGDVGDKHAAPAV